MARPQKLDEVPGQVVRPRLFAAFVPGMIKQSGRRVIRVRRHQPDLPGNIVVIRNRFVEQVGILRIKRLGHVQTVQPHLMRIPLFVPEPAIAGARLGLELFSQQSRSLLIPLFMGELPEIQHRLARH